MATKSSFCNRLFFLLWGQKRLGFFRKTKLNNWNNNWKDLMGFFWVKAKKIQNWISGILIDSTSNSHASPGVSHQFKNNCWNAFLTKVLTNIPCIEKKILLQRQSHISLSIRLIRCDRNWFSGIRSDCSSFAAALLDLLIWLLIVSGASGLNYKSTACDWLTLWRHLPLW